MQNRNNANRILLDKINKLEKQENRTDSKLKAKPIEKYTLLFSVVAIIVSITSLYFQFFYERNYLISNFVDFEISNDTTLVSKIIYHNKGNLNETILSNTIIFYQDSTDMENKKIIFSQNSTKVSNDITFDPIILTPGQQIFKELKQPFNFANIEDNLNSIKLNDTIRIALQVGFINDYGLHSTNFIKVGWLTLDKDNNVEYWQADYKSKLLESDIYTSSSYVKPKKESKAQK